MLRLLFRLIGLLLLATSFAAAIIDGTKSIAADGLVLTSIGEAAQTLFPARFALLQPAIEKSLWPFVWDPVLVTFMMLPAWLLLGALGIALIVITRPARALIGYSSR